MYYVSRHQPALDRLLLSIWVRCTSNSAAAVSPCQLTYLFYGFGQNQLPGTPVPSEPKTVTWYILSLLKSRNQHTPRAALLAMRSHKLFFVLHLNIERVASKILFVCFLEGIGTTGLAYRPAESHQASFISPRRGRQERLFRRLPPRCQL